MTDPLSALRFITEADVWKSGVLAGRLTRDSDGRVEFTYDPAYTGQPIASTLPLDAGPVRTGSAGLPAFFAGLLPEGHRLTALQRSVKSSPDDELSVLLAVGADTPGDVQVVPARTEPSEPAPLADAEPSELDFSLLTAAADTHALPGVQSKASASMITTPLAMGGQRTILKLNSPEHPHLVLNEALHLHAAHGLKIAVAQSEVIHDRNERPGLLVQRFDRYFAHSQWLRYAMEDGAQALGLLPASKYTVAAEDLVQRLAELTRAPLLAARNLYLQFVFAWLTGNGDLHAKNVSILADAEGRFSVAPIYDVVCTLLYGDETMALPIAGRTQRIRPRHWSEFADSIGLPQKAARSCDLLALRAAAAIDLSSLPLTGSPLNRAVRELRLRRNELAASA